MMRTIAIALLGLILGTTGYAQQFKVATLAPDGSNWMDQMRMAAERVEQRTDGQVSVRFYPGGVMGDSSAVLRRMRLGQLHGGAFTLGDLADVSAAVNLYSMPFVFQSLEEIQALREEFDPLVLQGLAEGGLVASAISLGGFALLFSHRELPQQAEQVTSAFRIWVPAGDRLSQQTLERAGATPVPLPLADVYTALQTGAVNTFAATPSAAIVLQWHTRVRSVLDMPLLMTAGTVGFDQRAISRLSDEQARILSEEFAAALNQIEAQNRADNQEARTALRKQGIQFVSPAADAVSGWHDLARRIRRQALEAGDVTLPHFERLEQRLATLRGQ